jgi:hypothetical protein
MLNIEGHFRAWWEHHTRAYDIIFVRHENLREESVRKQVAEFLDAPKLLNYDFKQRLSNWRTLSAVEKQNFERLLGAFRDWQATLPPVSIFYGSR